MNDLVHLSDDEPECSDAVVLGRGADRVKVGRVALHVQVLGGMAREAPPRPKRLPAFGVAVRPPDRGCEVVGSLAGERRLARDGRDGGQPSKDGTCGYTVGPAELATEDGGDRGPLREREPIEENEGDARIRS